MIKPLMKQNKALVLDKKQDSLLADAVVELSKEQVEEVVGGYASASETYKGKIGSSFLS